MTELTYRVSAGSPAAVLVEVTINAADGSDDGGADAQWVGRRLTGTLSLASHVLKKNKEYLFDMSKIAAGYVHLPRDCTWHSMG